MEAHAEREVDVTNIPTLTAAQSSTALRALRFGRHRSSDRNGRRRRRCCQLFVEVFALNAGANEQYRHASDHLAMSAISRRQRPTSARMMSHSISKASVIVYGATLGIVYANLGRAAVREDVTSE
jgi:hypothetical protein